MEKKSQKLSATVAQLSDEELHIMCDEIFTWKHRTGLLPLNSQLRAFSTTAHVNLYTAEEMILNEASERFHKMTILLMSERPYLFLNYKKAEREETSYD